ncbi:MAG: septum formation protein Maf [Bacteroidota bacterium]
MSLPPFRKIILGSGSPRRKQLLEGLGWPITVHTKELDEIFPEHLTEANIPLHLAELKAMAFDQELKQDELLITADTIVWLNGKVLGKPIDENDAKRMLSVLQNNTHQVFTGVCLTFDGRRHCFSVRTDVTFEPLSAETIESYVTHYRPMDKAGSYGAQECLPPEADPLSKEEKIFLERIGKKELFRSSLASDPERLVPMIKRIDGSYFNVMGLPVAELWEELIHFSNSYR